ncbi:glycosyl transferase [candidate division KSB1 bacterium]|nr:glycosyl transferase [candidate division KSB1 bacterium]
MRVLYAIQGTGNGHISRARDIIPVLQKYCDLDILISGTQADVQLECPVTYRRKGMSFIFGKQGGVDIWNTYIKTNFLRIQNEIRSIPIKEYDFVINDFEPISAWACYLKRVPCLALSHQAALLDKNVPKPRKRDAFGSFILKNYAPALLSIGLHFQAYSEKIYTPVIRRQIRELAIDEYDHYTVYLPSYDHKKLIKRLSNFGNVKWHVFSKHAKSTEIIDNISVYPVENRGFVHSMATAKGVLCGAGFETPAEALFLQKKLLIVPMKKQYEQHYNAAALSDMGIPVLKNLKNAQMHNIAVWLDEERNVAVNYENLTTQIIEKIFAADMLRALKTKSWNRNFSLYFRQKEQRTQHIKSCAA